MEPFKERRKNPHEHIESCQAAIRQHIDDRFDSLEAMLRSSVPNGDLEGHRRAHETVIESAAGRAALWKAVLEKTISGSIWAAIVLLAMALWDYIKLASKQ